MRVAVQDVGGHVQSLGERELRIHQVQRRAEQRGGHFGGESEADWLLLERVWRVVGEAHVVCRHVVKHLKGATTLDAESAELKEVVRFQALSTRDCYCESLKRTACK